MPLSRIALSLVIAAALAACGSEKTSSGPAEKPHEHPDAPHGGEMLDLGAEVAHLELIHDHVGGSVIVYVLGADAKTPVQVEAPLVNLSTKDGPVQFTLTAVNPGPDGKADTWKGAHAGLKVDPWDGNIRVKIGDKTYSSPLEGEMHDH